MYQREGYPKKIENLPLRRDNPIESPIKLGMMKNEKINKSKKLSKTPTILHLENKNLKKKKRPVFSSLKSVRKTLEKKKKLEENNDLNTTDFLFRKSRKDEIEFTSLRNFSQKYNSVQKVL